jgi:hypothetical protein
VVVRAKHKARESDDGAEAWQQLERIVNFGYDNARVFGDWVDLALSFFL